MAKGGGSGMRIEIIGDKELLTKLRQLGSAVAGNALKEAAMAGAEIVVDAAKARAPRRTGQGAETIHAEFIDTKGDSITVDVGPDLKKGFHLKFVEFGTPPHTIRPKRKKALAFPGGAHPVRVIHHPGTPARPFMRPAIDENEGRVRDKVGQVLKSKIDQVTR